MQVKNATLHSGQEGTNNFFQLNTVVFFLELNFWTVLARCYQCCLSFWSFLARFWYLGPKMTKNFLFSLSKQVSTFPHCAAAATGGKWGYRAFKHLYIKLLFLYKSHYCATLCSPRKTGLKITVLWSKLEIIFFKKFKLD